jgi:GT2 family glycosyltransferase
LFVFEKLRGNLFVNHDIIAAASRSLPSACQISVVIISWNTRELLFKCLKSLFADLATSGIDKYEVLVVDNASGDGTCSMVREHFPDTHLLENTQNAGFARANNQAIRQSTGSYVLLLNPDTQVIPGAMATLVRFLETHPEVGAVGPRVLNPDGTLQESCHPLPTLAREVWRLFHLDSLRSFAQYPMHSWDVENARGVDALLGACLLVRREVLAQTGLLDEDYFIYSEEVDLCYRISKASWLMYWVPQAQIIHYGGQSTQQVAASMFLRLYQGKVIYFRKNHGTLASRYYKLVLIAAGVTRLALSPLALLEHAQRRKHHLALTRSYWRLLTALPTF